MTELLSVISQLQCLIVPHINGCVITLTTFFIYSMLNRESLYFVNVTQKGKWIWATVVCSSSGSGGEICRNVVKEMFVNVRWSAAHDETSIQINPLLYQANHWSIRNWKMCYMPRLLTLRCIYIHRLSYSLY